MSDLYDVKISVMSTVKLLPEIKGCLQMNPNRERYEATWFMASVEFIKGLADQDDCNFSGHTQDGNFVEVLDEKMGQKSNRVSVEEGDDVLDSERDGVHLSETNDAIQQAGNVSTMTSTILQARNVSIAEFFDLKNQVATDLNPKESEEIPNFFSDHKDTSNHTAGVSTEPMPASSSSHLGNDEVASHVDDRIEIDAENAKDDYTNSQHHLDLLIKACTFKIKISTIDVLVPPNADDRLLRTMKPSDTCDQVDVDHFEDNYMLMLNDEEKPVKSSLDDMELEQQPKKTKSKIMKTDVIVPPIFLENLSRLDDYKRDKVTVPDYMFEFIKNKAMPHYQFPWGKQNIVVVRRFWLSIACFNIGKIGWLNDHYLDLWVDLMRSLRPPEADWAMCLAELKIHNGVVTFYDSLGWASGNRRRWWRQMKKLLPKKLTLYLHMHGVLESKGISADSYKITYKYADAPFQAALFGDCGIWVCIFLYRLCRNLPLTVDDPLETALSYRERIL
ncbi:phospholipase-like protein [Tanacetum coccineum]